MQRLYEVINNENLRRKKRYVTVEKVKENKEILQEKRGNKKIFL